MDDEGVDVHAVGMHRPRRVVEHDPQSRPAQRGEPDQAAQFARALLQRLGLGVSCRVRQRVDLSLQLGLPLLQVSVAIGLFLDESPEIVLPLGPDLAVGARGEVAGHDEESDERRGECGHQMGGPPLLDLAVGVAGAAGSSGEHPAEPLTQRTDHHGRPPPEPFRSASVRGPSAGGIWTSRTGAGTPPPLG